MPTLALLLALAMASGEEHPDLAEAERAFKEGRYQHLLAPLGRALEGQLTREQEVRACELQAFAHAAFDDSPAAIAAFERALEADPAYDPGPKASPKLLGLFAEAQRRRGPPPALAATPPPPPEPAPRAEGKLGWVIWTVAAVVAVGAGSAVYLGQRPRVPRGNLPNGELW
ncbi:MAG: hypothetical protein HYZ28_16280 [Myxococcales bacterium]|nr:hypothetical protein [Myxococcales bacterium]